LSWEVSGGVLRDFGELWGARQGSGVRDQFSAYRNVEMKGGGSAKVFEKRTGGGLVGPQGLIRLRKEAISGGKV